jgi:hypothetical protein
MNGRRRFAWLAILVGDVSLLGWGAMAALAPSLLPGPGSLSIMPAGYEGFSGASWPALVTASPGAAGFMEVLFRVYGAYIVAFSLLAIFIVSTAFRRGERWAWWSLLIGNTIAYGSAMAYDRVVQAIGPLELSEYLGLGLIYLALAITAPFVMPRTSRVEARV